MKQYLLHSYNNDKITKYLREGIITRAVFTKHKVKIEFDDLISYKHREMILEDIEFGEFESKQDYGVFN